MCVPQHSSRTRRQLLAQGVRISAGIALSKHLSIAEALQVPEALANAVATRRKAQIFALDTVRLEAGPFREAMERNRVYLLSLDPDRFLHYFRTTAGLTAKAEAYGGWETKVGRMLGHYLSACSMYAQATGSADFAKRQDYVVAELAACQKANGDGYVGGVQDARRIFREIAAGNIYFDKTGLNGVHAPWYMLHKMAAGLRDAYAYGQNRQALAVLTAFADWADRLTVGLSDADMQKMLIEEHGGMNEVFADLSVYRRDLKYMTLSRRFNRRSVLEPLTRGVDDLDGLHANTQIPTALGLYRQYEVTGDSAAARGGEFFWETVVQHRSYVIGGDSDKERFYPRGQMGANLSIATAETCNSYNMVKLTDRLFAGTPREEFAAYSERVLWNDILASIDDSSPGMTYYMSLAPGHFKTFSKPYESFWCCVGTGMENHAKYGESLYFSSPAELWINQFIASTVHWKDKGITLVQTTKFPMEATSKWKVSCQKPVRAVLHLRHPAWVDGSMNVAINGKPVTGGTPGSYLTMNREWRNGDTITASLPMRLRIEAMADDPSWNAVLYGPLVLAGLLGREGMPAGAPYAGESQMEYRSVPDPVVPPLPGAGLGLDQWLKQSGPLEFTSIAREGHASLRFVPLAKVTDQRYSVYWKIA